VHVIAVITRVFEVFVFDGDVEIEVEVKVEEAVEGSSRVVVVLLEGGGGWVVKPLVVRFTRGRSTATASTIVDHIWTSCRISNGRHPDARLMGSWPGRM
jgi:hypothetical protein